MQRQKRNYTKHIFDMEDVRYIDSLKDVHKNQDIWVIGAGSSMNYVDPSFFDNKITVGLNHVGVKYKTKYIVTKDLVKNGFGELPNVDNPPFNSEYIIASEWDKGGLGPSKNCDETACDLYRKYKSKFYFFKHQKSKFGDTSVINKNSSELFLSTSTITSAVHFSGFLGAKNIIICGHDILAIDNKLYFDEYTRKSSTGVQDFWNKRNFKNETMILRDIMKKEYGTNIFSLNPFIGFGLEGHSYESLK